MPLVLEGEGFQLPSPQAKVSYFCAQKLQVWMSDPINCSREEVFARNLVYHLQQCFIYSCHSCATRERVWENYYKLRSFAKFRDMWTVFLRDSIDVEANPIFYQFVSDSTLEELLKLNFLVQSPSRNTVLPIDYMEANAIRYVSGYVFRSAKKE